MPHHHERRAFTNCAMKIPLDPDDMPEAQIDEEVADDLRAERAKIKAERSRLRKAADRLGWKLIGRDTVEIKIERTFTLGPRTVIVRGRVPVPRPDEMTAAEGERALGPIVDPTVGQFRHAMERTAAKMLSAPDDVTQTHVFERGSFFTALEDARRGLASAYTALENRRIDARVEADLGLRFYIEGFTREVRTFEYYAGPTNSGKTHAALERLRAVESGVYLAPLRLLALEVHERLGELGVPTSLVTGEERMLNAHAGHVSATVEMVDLSRAVDVAVIDEAQMLDDPARGWAWTLAIAGVRAKHVILCGSEDGLVTARHLADRLGVRIDVRRFERKNPLHIVDAIAPTTLRRGDAIVAFSRNAVVEMQGRVARLGFSSAAIYGSLSPAVRRREAARFRSGAADVLIATDAIGLGLNLPIRRIIFAAVEKFDGIVTRLLSPPEIRQIAGRAGRYGIHEEGAVTAFEARDVRYLKANLDRFAPPDAEQPIWISPTDEHLRRLAAIIGTTRVSRLLQFFQTRVLRDVDTGVRIANLADTIDVASALEISESFLNLPLDVRSTYSRAPVSTRGPGLGVLTRWGEQHAELGFVSGAELTTTANARDRLLLYEDRSRLATLYLWLAQRFPDVYVNGSEVMRVRESLDDDIHDALLQQGSRPRRERTQEKPRRRPAGPPKFNKRRLPK
jgi:ATP-dependent RNA helicase SUPV3L1/SUV3